MINKDYILRLAERLGRTLAIILGLREANRYEEALLYIDDVLFQTVGLTSRFINSLSEESLVQVLSPLGTLLAEKCLWVASLLQAEGEIYEDKGDPDVAYYRYLKSLYLYLEVLLQDPSLFASEVAEKVEALLDKLDEYELPVDVKKKLFLYDELKGNYAKAEDTLFEVLEAHPSDQKLFEQGRAFYARLRVKSNEDLLAGNLSREEVEEGLHQLEMLSQ